MTEANDNAYPIVEQDRYLNHLFHSKGGLTKREYFAAMAMQGILANAYLSQIAINKLKPDAVAAFYAVTAQEHADALIKQLNESK